MCGALVLVAHRVASYNVLRQTDAGRKEERGRGASQLPPEEGARGVLSSRLPDQDLVPQPYLAAKESGKCRFYFYPICEKVFNNKCEICVYWVGHYPRKIHVLPRTSECDLIRSWVLADVILYGEVIPK